MRLVSVTIALIVSITGFTQKKIPSFGTIDAADLKLTSCSFEPEATAMKLFDITETEFTILVDGYPKIRIERRVRIKIFNEKGYEYATVRIPYLSKKGIGKIKELKGMIYSLDSSGNVMKDELEKKDFFKEKMIENIGMVSFTFPRLKTGSVVEYSYTLIENKIAQIDPWIIQGEIPVQYSSFSIKCPPQVILKEKLFGPDTVEFKNKITGHYTPDKKIYFKENTRSFKPEPFMTSEKDNLMKMVFFVIPRAGFQTDYLLTSGRIWQEVGEYFLNSEKVKGQIKKNIPGTEKILDSAAKLSSTNEKIRYIYTSVRSRIPEKTEQTIHPDDVVEAWKTQVGNSADINIILLNLLEKANITCYPLLVSTRDHGVISKDFPTFSQLNGLDVVAITDSASYFVLDASLKFQSINNPPLNILNREALLLRADNINWFLIEDNRPLMKQGINLFCDMKESGLIEGQATVQHYHYAKSYIVDTTLKEEKSKNEKYFDKKTIGLTILSSKQEITGNENDPAYETILFTYQPQQTENFYFVNPQFLSIQKSNPFVADDRKTDIDLLCNQENIISITLTIPPSFEVDHLPKNIIVRAPDSSFYYKRVYSAAGSNISMTNIFEVKRAIFSRDDYAGIKDFFGRMYTLMNEEIVLKKKD